MKKGDAAFYIIACLMTLSLMVAWKLFFKTYNQQDSVDIHRFPTTIGGWNSRELVITESEYAILETRNVFVREYSNQKNEKVQLFVVFSESNRKVSHPPEICYVGGGVTILSKTRDFINRENPGFEVSTNKLLLEQGTTKQVAYYWFKVGDTFTSQYWKQQLLIVLKTLLGKPASSALIRVSATIENDDQERSEEIIRNFSNSIIPLIKTYLP